MVPARRGHLGAILQNRRTVAKPIPLPPPVTKTTLFCNDGMKIISRFKPVVGFGRRA